ncbi:unnamed protein product [Dicrocoelium dendriticum]|nr:unnamed protein product [Dicrocoelium dendriticum]
MEQRKRNKQCSVCGDMAMGYNFGAVACESCKAFFRRTARKNKPSVCLFNEECVIGVTTRRFCSHCRLKKCFSVGMKTCLILDEKAKRERHEKISRNRLTRSFPRSRSLMQRDPVLALSSRHFTSTLQSTDRMCGSEAGGIAPTPSLTISPSTQVSVTQPACTMYTSDQWPSFMDLPVGAGQDSSQMSELNTSAHCRNGLLSSSPYSCNSTEFTAARPLDGVDTDSSAFARTDYPHCISSASSHSHRHPNHRFHSTHNPNDDDMARLLSHYQWTAINDLRNAYETNFVQDESCSNLKRPDLTLSSLVNTSRFLVRRLINFAKTLTDFSQLKQDCQISLLKGVVLSTLFLLSARHYDVEKDVWLTPKGEVSTQILKIATGIDKFYEEHTKYCRDFNDLVAQDPNLVALMQTLCLFTPDRPALDARQMVAKKCGLRLRHIW